VKNLLREVLCSRVYDVARETPLEAAPKLSARLQREVLFKREDLQPVFSFKATRRLQQNRPTFRR